jgi:hypothetical protein
LAANGTVTQPPMQQSHSGIGPDALHCAAMAPMLGKPYRLTS